MTRLLFTLLLLLYGAGIGSVCWVLVWALSHFNIWQAMFMGATAMAVFLFYVSEIEK